MDTERSKVSSTVVCSKVAWTTVVSLRVVLSMLLSLMLVIHQSDCGVFNKCMFVKLVGLWLVVCQKNVSIQNVSRCIIPRFFKPRFIIPRFIIPRFIIPRFNEQTVSY
jgi:hypothetical protein